MARMQEPVLHTTVRRDGKDLEVLLFDDLVIVFDLIRGVRVGDHSLTDVPQEIADRLERFTAVSLA